MQIEFVIYKPLIHEKCHQQVKHMTGNNKSDISIPFPGVTDGNYVTTRSTTSLSVFLSKFPLVNLSALEAYLPAIDPPHHSTHGKYYAELRKVKATKVTGPDGIPPKLVKDFANEVSSPLNEVLNSSYEEEGVPTQWKGAFRYPKPPKACFPD